MRKLWAFVSNFPANRWERGAVPALITKGIEAKHSYFGHSSNKIRQIKTKVGNGFGSLF